MPYVTVDVYIDEVLDELSDKELLEELKERGYTAVRTEGYEALFDREDWQYLLEIVDKQPVTWYTRRVRDKLLEARFSE